CGGDILRPAAWSGESKLPPALKSGGFPVSLSRSPGGSRFWLRRPPVLRPAYTWPEPSTRFEGGGSVGMGSVPTCLADELGLALSVGLLAMPALRTGSGRVPRVHRHDGDPGPLRLVRQEGIESPERPSREAIPGVGATSRDPLANALEVFKRDAASGAF